VVVVIGARSLGRLVRSLLIVSRTVSIILVPEFEMSLIYLLMVVVLIVRP
jgi:hypothetical protein